MSVTVNGRYLGDKKVELVHEPSGATITTSAPIDNGGDGTKFSPTDLVAGALGSCTLTVMGIYAERHNIDISGANFTVQKIMSQSPRRIGELPLTINLPSSLTEDQRLVLERAAKSCPVHHSLHPEINVLVQFDYS